MKRFLILTFTLFPVATNAVDREDLVDGRCFWFGHTLPEGGNSCSFRNIPIGYTSFVEFQWAANSVRLSTGLSNADMFDNNSPYWSFCGTRASEENPVGTLCGGCCSSSCPTRYAMGQIVDLSLRVPIGQPPEVTRCVEGIKVSDGINTECRSFFVIRVEMRHVNARYHLLNQKGGGGASLYEFTWDPGDYDGLALVRISGGFATSEELSPDQTSVVVETDDPDSIVIKAGQFSEGQGNRFIRGDCDGDGQVTGTVNDAVFLLRYVFQREQAPSCHAACDSDGNGKIEGITDAIYLLLHNFTGTASPPAPFPDCGLLQTRSDFDLGCDVTSTTCIPTPDEG